MAGNRSKALHAAAEAAGNQEASGLKRLKNAQLHDGIVRSSGDWGASSQQAAYVLWEAQMHCLRLLCQLGTIPVIPRNELYRM